MIKLKSFDKNKIMFIYLILAFRILFIPLVLSQPAAIKTLKDANKIVYTILGYSYETKWEDLLNPSDPAKFNKILCGLMTTITEDRIDGIIINIGELYDGRVDAKNLINFTKVLKDKMPNLKVGLFVDLSDTIDRVTDNSQFDFTVVNSEIDFYYVKVFTRVNLCTPEVFKTGTIITSTDPNALTVEKISNAVYNSSMDKSKTIAKVQIGVIKENDGGGATYSQYCDSENAADSCNWCADHSQKLYDEGKTVKDYFHGISIAWCDYDDPVDTCQCQKFPVTNIIFDGWDGVPLTACAEIDTL